MATLLSRATGNWTSASTWSLVDPTSFTGVSSEATSAGVGTTYVSSSTFTPGAITIDAIAVHLALRTSVAPTGTFSVALDQAAVTVTGTEVTVNLVDLPPAAGSATAEGGWIVFKFAAPVTLAAATAYSVKVKASGGAGLITLFSVSSFNWARMLRTTATQAPVAGDDLHIAGEYTGAGTSNSFTVTMNETAATDYGSAPSAVNSLITPGVGISSKATLQFADTAAANPYLRLSSSLIVYIGGTLNLGTTGTPIPRDSRAILEFDQLSADGDYGLTARNGGILNGQGLSRSSGKNVVSCKLSANAPSVTNLLAGVLSTTSNVSVTAFAALGPDGISRMATAVTDNASNAGHLLHWTSGNVNNVTQTLSIWLARGTGTNNRYCRVQLATNGNVTPVNGFYVDVDLQAGTIGTVTAIGVGAATSASISALGPGYLVTIIGKLSTAGAAQPFAAVCASNAPGVVTYAGDATNNFNIYGQQLFTAAALPSADLTVDTDTGWLAGDMIAVAATSRTPADCESLVLASNAGASTMTSSEVITNNHSGVAPTQAEIILLTRNVVVRSTSSTLMAYVSVQAGSVIDLDWVQFYYLGRNVANKRGIEVTGSLSLVVNFDMQYCSVHDCDEQGVYLFPSGVGSLILMTKMVFSYNTMWNLALLVGSGVQIANATNPANWTIDHNILIRIGPGSSNGFALGDVGGIFTNNVAVGAPGSGITLTENIGIIGTCSGNISHSNGGVGFNLGAAGMAGVMASTAVWRNGSSGLACPASMYDLLVSDLVAFGNSSQNVSISGSCSIRFKAPILSGDTTFSTASGLAITNNSLPNILIEDGDFSTVTGIKTAHTQDLNISVLSEPQIILRNTKLGATLELSSTTSLNMSERGYISSQKHDQVAGNHLSWLRNGQLQSDNAIYRTGAPSMRMTPSMAPHLLTASGTVTDASPIITAVPVYFCNFVAVGDWLVASSGFTSGARITAVNAGTSTITMDRPATTTSVGVSLTLYRGKLPSAPPDKGFLIAANSGQTFNVGVWVTVSPGYNGYVNPRLIQRANPAIGIASEVVLDTMTGGSGAWEQLTGMTIAPTGDSGVIELYVDCEGTTGWVNVDDFTVS